MRQKVELYAVRAPEAYVIGQAVTPTLVVDVLSNDISDDETSAEIESLEEELYNLTTETSTGHKWVLIEGQEEDEEELATSTTLNPFTTSEEEQETTTSARITEDASSTTETPYIEDLIYDEETTTPAAVEVVRTERPIIERTPFGTYRIIVKK